MFMLRVIAVGAVVVWSTPGASIIPGDARRGEQLFHSEQCIQCHSLKGKGGTLAPDLSRRVGRDYTPSVMASLMWNHAPDMWTAMKQQGVKKGNMTPERPRICSPTSCRPATSKWPGTARAASRHLPPGTAPIATASPVRRQRPRHPWPSGCLLYTSDAADE